MTSLKNTTDFETLFRYNYIPGYALQSAADHNELGSSAAR